jgi:hypothetical protein
MLTGSWNVRILLRKGSLIMFTEQLNVYNLQITATKEDYKATRLWVQKIHPLPIQ